MAINSVSAYQGASLVDYLHEAQDAFQPSQLASAEQQTAASAPVRQQKKAYAAQNIFSATGQAALKRALQELSEKVDGKITFGKIAEYQKELEEEFAITTRVALQKKGVDINTPFTLTLTPEGAVEVACDDARSKEIIGQFLQDNKKVKDQFLYIQSLSNLERAKQGSGIAHLPQMRDVKSVVQSSAVENFFSAAMGAGMGYSPLMADFGQGQMDAAYFTGLRYKV